MEAVADVMEEKYFTLFMWALGTIVACVGLLGLFFSSTLLVSLIIYKVELREQRTVYLNSKIFSESVNTVVKVKDGN